MTSHEIFEQYERYVIGNYQRVASVIVGGQGGRIRDAEGREYIDMFPGFAVSGIGHCHPKVVEAIQRQAKELIHIDNVFYNPYQGQLAQMLSERSFGGKCFFCNSGTEAVEAALKLARRATAKEKYKVISAVGGFHGRTMGALTATAQPKFHEGILPLVPGFIYVPFNDAAALEAAFDDEVAAVIMEPIQGEGGIQVATTSYLEAIRGLCDEHGAVAIWDEIQCGMGRTGKWFDYQHSGVEPDIMTLAKSLGGGVAIGAMMARAEVAEAFGPGSHGSTFGGNPLACAAAIATIEVIEQEQLLAHAEEMGHTAQQKLQELKEKHRCIQQIRGRGLMIGIELSDAGAAVVQSCWSKGMRINCTQETVLRFMPAMNVTPVEIDEAVEILDESLAEVYEQARL